ncbi:MAG: response regulator transcription factor [Betaproteobacteria bacterium]|nr:response regulator transcription factor [Betaproteobacteria bacterium]
MNQRVRTPLAMVRVLRILVVESVAAERHRLVATLAEQPGVEIVGDTESPERALALAASVLPDVVLLTAKLEDARHGEVVTKLRAAAPGAHVLVLTRSEEEEALLEALHAGASGYLVRNLDGGLMADALRCTVEHGGLFGYRSATDLSAPPASPLSPREQQILILIAEGWTNKQIARELGVAESTVKIHVQHILRKLKLESRVQAAVYATENGLALKH